jgi:hypothetical protein
MQKFVGDEFGTAHSSGTLRRLVKALIGKGPTFCRILEGNRASVPFPSEIHAIYCREKLPPNWPLPPFSPLFFLTSLFAAGLPA